MPLLLRKDELSELMQSFYTLTGIRIVLFDKDYKEIASYPNDTTTFCMKMRQNPDFDKKCKMCDYTYFKNCGTTDDVKIYKCHANLTEAMMPITNENSIIGYLLFGQIHSFKNKNEFEENMKDLVKTYKGNEDLTKEIKKIKYKTQSQILSASTILKACVEYLRIKEIVRSAKAELTEDISKYIDEHITEQITIKDILTHFNIKRTSLYNLIGTHFNMGVAKFILTKRLQKAKHLLKTTDLKVSEISDMTGFSDYNYFLRLFKKEYKVSCKEYRKTNQE